jgi:general secretion pathway protein N
VSHPAIIDAARWSLKSSAESGRVTNVENSHLKMLKKGLLALGLLLLFALVLLWFLPARLALLWIAPQLHGVRLQQVDGLLWEGHADQVTTSDGQLLGKLNWRLSRAALLGKTQLQLDFTGSELDFSGAMRKLPQGQIEWRDVHARMDLSLLDVYAAKLPQGQPAGELQLIVEHALLQAGWPLELQAKTQWSNASIKTRGSDIVLGALQLQAQAQNGVISAQLHDDGHGPLHADGQLQLSPLGWRLDATLLPQQSDAALRQWLAQFGQPDSSGALHIQRSGGMAMGLPPPTSDRTPH